MYICSVREFFGHDSGVSLAYRSTHLESQMSVVSPFLGLAPSCRVMPLFDDL